MTIMVNPIPGAGSGSSATNCPIGTDNFVFAVQNLAFFKSAVVQDFEGGLRVGLLNRQTASSGGAALSFLGKRGDWALDSLFQSQEHKCADHIRQADRAES